MEDIYENRKGAIDNPHRHDYYTVLLVKDAKGEHKIDFESFAMHSQQVHFVAPGQVHQVIESSKSFGYVLTFSNQFLINNAIPISFIESLNLFQNYGYSPPLETMHDEFENIYEYGRRIEELYNSAEEMKSWSIGSYLKLLLIKCNQVCSTDPIEDHSSGSGAQLVREFKKLVNLNYKNQHSASFYAQELHVSPEHLSRIIKSLIGKTTKEYIQSRIVTEAKRLLYFTDLNTKEIAFNLGFSEPGNFSAFFKKCSGVSPSEFKNAHKVG